MIGKSLGPYKILEQIGSGAMGEVYLAEDARLGRRIAVKVLPAEFAADPSRLARFEQEARAIAALTHPNIVTIHSVEEVGGVRLITMEYVDGATLGELIPGGGMPRERFFEIAVPIAAALSAAHERGITHRDLKPANIMVADDGRVKILDFGLAKLADKVEVDLEADGPTELLTREGTIVGTAAYMSPEQAQGKPVDHLSDIFSLGIILYEMATGERPFRGDSPAELVSAILRDAPRPLGELNVAMPGELARLVERCLEKNPRRRIQTALDVRNELQRLEAAGKPTKTGASTAVLPFADMSPERDQEYFCEGIAEELINALAKIPNLHVASRTSAFQFKGSAKDIREIGRQLGVESVLEGSVRKAGSRIRITAQLVSIADGYQLWSDRYDRELQDVFAIQDEISQSIVDALEVTFGPSEKVPAEKASTTDIEAYEYYLRGRHYFHRFNRRDQEFARRMFTRAIEIDPHYARAHAGIADCSSFLWMYFERDDAHLQQADESSKRALELDPDLAQAHASRGLALSLNHRFDDAEAEFHEAIRLDAKLFEAYYFYARAALAEGQQLKAAELFEKACEVRPEDYAAPTLLATLYEGLGRADKAAEADRRSFAIIEKHRRLNPDDARAIYFGAGALIRTGRREQGLGWAREALALGADDPIVLYNVACVYANAHEIEDAVDCLEKAVEVGYAHKEWIQNDHDLDPLRENARFQALLQCLE
ncbi:MAG: protein kinase [Acidobacteriota bacterium]|jgi:TolB-like protein/Flp pilus assembly protein TadD